MITSFNGRRAALLTVAFLLAICSTTSGQSSSVIPNVRALELLSADDAGTLRTHLVSKLQGKPDKISTSERITISGNRKTVTCDIVSQLVTYKTGNLEQITVRFTEEGVTNSINLVQYANGELGVLEGGKLVTYSLASPQQTCLDALFGPGSNCATCRTKVNNCRNSSNRVVKILGCLLRNIDGSCLACGVDYYAISVCILLP